MKVRLVAVLFGLTTITSAASGQSQRIEIGAGFVSTAGALGDAHANGPSVRAAVVFMHPNPWWRLRLDGQFMTLAARESATAGANTSRLNGLSLMSDLQISAPWRRVSPYLLIGTGLQGLYRGGSAGTGSVALAFRGGLGVRVPVRGVELNVEFAPTVALSSVGANADVWAVSYRSISIGVLR